MQLLFPNPLKMLLEIVCTNMDSVYAAIEGKADRIELCEHLEVGGITPTRQFIRQTKKIASGIPLHVLIRPRAGDFVYSEAEVKQMEEDIRYCTSIGIEGIVVGCLLPNGKIDVAKTKRFVTMAHPLPVTFHRAFDVASEYPEMLEEVIATGCSRLLSSGRAPSAFLGAENLRRMIMESRGRMVILPGGGIREDHVAELVRLTGAIEIHSSCLNFDRKSDQPSPEFFGKELLPEQEKRVPNPKDILRIKLVAESKIV